LPVNGNSGSSSLSIGFPNNKFLICLLKHKIKVKL
jgi:hypothetical protein